MFRILYKPIGKIEILHDYFQLPGEDSLPENYDFRQFMEIVPSSETVRLMKGYRLAFRQNAQGGILLASVQEQNGKHQTLIPIKKNLKLTFLLKIKDWRFYNYTNLPLTRNSERLFYFNNLSENVKGNVLYLSHSLPKVDSNSTESYFFGDLVRRKNDHYIYEAIEAGASVAVISDEDKWQNTASQKEYISRADSLPRLSDYYLYEGPNSNAGKQVSLGLFDDFNREKPLGYIPQTKRPVGLFQAPKDSTEPLRFKLGLQGFAPGVYRLLIDRNLGSKEEHIFYLLDSKNHENIWGVMDLYFSEEVPESYQLFDLTNYQIAEPVKEYRLQFKNRSTLWHYIFPEHFDMNRCTSSALEPTFPFEAEKEKHLVKFKKPRPLLKNDISKLKLQCNNDLNFFLPSPSPDRIQAVTANDEGALEAVYSNIHLFIRKK